MYRLFSYADLLLVPYLGDFQLFFLISFPSPSPLFSLSGSPIFCCASPRSLKLCPFSFFYLFSKLVCSQVYSSIICNVVLSQSSVVLKKKIFHSIFQHYTFSCIGKKPLSNSFCGCVISVLSSIDCLFSLDIFLALDMASDIVVFGTFVVLRFEALLGSFMYQDSIAAMWGASPGFPLGFH